MDSSDKCKKKITPEMWLAFWNDVLDGIKRAEHDFPLGMGPVDKDIPAEELRRADEAFERDRDEFEKAIEMINEQYRNGSFQKIE